MRFMNGVSHLALLLGLSSSPNIGRVRWHMKMKPQPVNDGLVDDLSTEQA